MKRDKGEEQIKEMREWWEKRKKERRRGKRIGRRKMEEEQVQYDKKETR